jgi:hypothetical protein
MTLTEGILAGAAVLFSAVAAYFAWQTHRRRPRLRLYVGDAANQVMYSDEDPGLAYIHATLANIGRAVATNVQGRMEFEPGRVHPHRRMTEGGGTIDPYITACSDNWATLFLGSLAPNRYPAADTLHARSFVNSPIHFIVPAQVAEEGPTRLSYWFVCDEGEMIERTVTLDFPKQTS